MTEAQRRMTGGEEQETEDRAICRTKPDWPGATSGLVCNPGNRARDVGVRLRGEEGTRLTLGCLWHCYGFCLMIISARWVETKR